MKNRSSDYFEDNLSKLYDIEDQRQKLDELAEAVIQKGGSLAEPEIIQKSNTVQHLMNEQTLGEMKKAALEREKKKQEKKDSGTVE